MNIVLISTHLLPRSTGGVEVFTELLARTLARAGHTVTLFTAGWKTPVRSGGVTIVYLPQLAAPLRLKGLLMPVYEQLLKRKLAHEPAIQKADIINAVDIDSITMLAGWKPIQNRFVATIHDYGLICANGLLLSGAHVSPDCCAEGKFLCLENRGLNPLAKRYLTLAYRIRKKYRDRKLPLLTHAVCVSRFVQKQLLRRAPHLRTAVIGNALPKQWWEKPEPKSRRSIDILYVGRLEWFKGTEYLLSALAPLVAQRPKTRIMFVGGGRTRKHERLAQRLGIAHAVIFAHNQPFRTIDRYYARAKIVVVPSVWPEPCGRVIIEAMFWGAAVISTNRGGTPELIRNGVNGLLVPAADTNSLTRTIERILINPDQRKRLGRNAMRAARRRYKPDLIAGRYMHFYQSIIASVLH